MIDKNAGMATNPQLYTDLSSLNNINVQARTDKAAAMKTLAHQFESMMVQQMMKSMRQANEAFGDGDIASSSEEKFYQDMFDSQLALSLSSKGRGFGIAEAMLRQFRGKYATGAETGASGATLEKDTAAVSLDGVRRQAVQAAASAATGADAIANPEFSEQLYRLFQGGDEPQRGPSAPVDAAAIDGSPENFVRTLRPVADRVAHQLGIDSRLLLSQAALETGWGQKVLQRSGGASSFNFFNIKAGSDWQGATVTVPTIEYQNGVAVRETATFRAYRSPEESFADYANLVAQNPRYQQALQRGGNAHAYIRSLAAAGYATDPQYADKVLAIYHGDQVGAAAPIDPRPVIYSDADEFSDTDWL